MKKFLKEQRLKSKLSKAEAALSLGVTIDLINAWEEGITAPDEKYLSKISAVYKILLPTVEHEMNVLAYKSNDDIFTMAIYNKKHLIDDSINLEKVELDLSPLDIRMLFSISLTISLGSSPYNALRDIIGNPIELNAAINRLKKAHLVEYYASKGSLCISDFGCIIIDIIEQEALYNGCCYRQHYIQHY